MGKPSPLPKHARDNRANQLNPNNDAYWRSRGFDAPPQTDTSAPEPLTAQGSAAPAKRKSD